MGLTRRHNTQFSTAAHRRLDAAAATAAIAGLLPLFALYLVYTLVRWSVVERGRSAGDGNALDVLDLERRLGIDWELWLQRHVLEHEPLVWIANHYYVFAFFPVLIGGAVLAAIRAPAAFRYWRTVFVVSLGIALAGFALIPLTPPRLLGAEYGFVDTLLQHGPRYYGDESGSSLFNAYGSIPSMVNEYAAMPSMHVGWSALAGFLLIAAFPGRRWLILLVALHVILMQLAVVATGNHFFVDGPAGLLVVAIAVLLTNKLPAYSRVGFGRGRSGQRGHFAPSGD